MRITALLADHAKAVEGKLYILGGGWSIGGPGPVGGALAVKIEVPWDQANQQNQLRIHLQDEDGDPVFVPGTDPPIPVEIVGQFEAGRPPGLKRGSPLDMCFAIPFGPLQLTPDRRYMWVFEINGEAVGEHLSFLTRAG